MCGKRSLTQRPDCPYWRKAQGDFITDPMLSNWVFSILPMAFLGSWPWYFSSIGL
jgi:hypothetical protein